MQINEIAVIIPFHVSTETNIELLKSAIASVPNEMEIYISCGNGEMNFPEDVTKRCTIVQESAETDFCSLVNAATEKIDKKWFSILEFDDTYTPIWFTNVVKYIDFMPSVSVFMPFEDITDYTSKKYINMGNVEAWASSFSNEIGYIDTDCLQNYFDFYLTGCVFNTDDWREIGGLKPHIKVTFWYEWLLRATNKGKQVYVIPKVGYNHILGRDDSLTSLYKKELSEKEVQWWFDLAKKDYFFKEEKEPSYYVYAEVEEEK